jgi:hypothetical protein
MVAHYYKCNHHYFFIDHLCSQLREGSEKSYFGTGNSEAFLWRFSSANCGGNFDFYHHWFNYLYLVFEVDIQFITMLGIAVVCFFIGNEKPLNIDFLRLYLSNKNHFFWGINK